MFQVAPLIVADYAPAASTLGLDWYEELREAAQPASRFTPSPVTPLREDFLDGAVAWATEALREAEADIERELDKALADLMPIIEQEVAAALRETITENSAEDPDALGWQRFARAGGCKFCLMLAARGAIFTEATARFAAHKNCNCVAGPAFSDGPRASVEQYVASRKNRTDAERARLREYLTENFPDAPG